MSFSVRIEQPRETHGESFRTQDRIWHCDECAKKEAESSRAPEGILRGYTEDAGGSRVSGGTALEMGLVVGPNTNRSAFYSFQTIRRLLEEQGMADLFLNLT